MDSGYELVVAFESDTPAFTRGVEIGMLYQRLRSEPLPLSATVHADNTEMVLRLADAVGASASSDELGGDWLAVTFA